MRPKHFVILAIAAGISVLLAFISYSAASRWSDGTVKGAKLFPSLAGDANRVERIEIRQGTSGLTLVKTGTGWGIAERNGYPAKTGQVHKLIIELAKAELIEAKTRRLDRHALIEVEEPSRAGAKSRLVRLMGAGGALLAEAVIGKRRYDAFGSGTQGTYVRLPNDLQSWLANASIEVPLEVRDWIESTVYSADAAKIQRVTVAVPGEEPLIAERSATSAPGTGRDTGEAVPGARFVDFPPAGKTLKEPTAAATLLQGAALIEADDVRPLAATPLDSGVSTVTVEAEGEPALHLRLRKEGDAYWLSFTAAGTGAAKAKADDIMAHKAGWEFKIPEWKAASLLKRRTGLLVETQKKP